jgi:uncharacterized integral membrane protein
VKLGGWLAVAAGAVVAGLFAFLNRFERVSVELGFARLYAVPLAIFFFAAFLLGMAAMLLLSLPHDRRLRALLRARGLAGDPPPPAAQTQVAPAPADYQRIPAPADPREPVQP